MRLSMTVAPSMPVLGRVEVDEDVRTGIRQFDDRISVTGDECIDADSGW